MRRGRSPRPPSAFPAGSHHVPVTLRRVRFRVGLGILLAALLLAAGQASAASPTRASWAAAANRRCAVAYAAIRRLPAITTATFVPDLRATLRIGRTLNNQLAAIPAPASERASVRRLIAISRGE